MKKSNRHKIIFMGGNLLGCLCLKEVLRLRNVNVLAVIGRYSDNGCVVDPTAWNASLLRVALEKQVPFLQPKTTSESVFLNEIYQLPKPDFILSIEYDDILAPELLYYPNVGCINIHFAVFPHNQESFPIPMALLNKEPVGATMHWLDEGIDTGDIIISKEIEVKPDDTAFSLYHKITNIAFKLFKQYFPLVLENKAPRVPQSSNGHNYHSLKYPHNRNIDWNWSAQKIDRMIRALTFPQLPAAKTYFNDLEVEILTPVEIMCNSINGANPGQIVGIQPDGLIVQTQKDRIFISKVRVNESLILNANKFCQQFNIHIGDTFYMKK